MYCSKCGRELKDGEVCNCTTNVEKPTIKFSDTVMSTVHFARDLFVNPSETIKSYFSLDYGKMAIKLILLKAVVAFVLVFAVFETLMSSNTVLTYITKSKFELGLFAFGISIFGDLIYGVAISFASRLAHCYLRFKACLQLATVAIPVNMAFMIVSAFVAFINVDASVYVLMFTILPTVALTTMAVSNIKGASENKKIFIPSVNEKYIAKWRQAVDLSETRPDPNVKIEDHDMNTWGIVSVGSGYDDKFKNITGYGLYKTTVNINENDNFIVFRELTGNEVEVFVNGEQKFKGDCQWGRKVEINVSDVNGDTDIAVIINSTKADSNGGISKPIVITD